MMTRITATTLPLAIGVARDRACPGHDRERAARLVAHMLGDRWEVADERTVADVCAAICASLDCPEVVAVLAPAVLLAASDSRRVAPALLRSADRAHRDGHHEAVFEIVCALLRCDDSREPPPTELASCAATQVERAGSVDGLARLLRVWRARFGLDHAWLHALVAERPDLLGNESLPWDLRIGLHETAPTSAGWIVLAGLLGERRSLLPTWQGLFVPAPDRYLATLDVALEQDLPIDARTVLARWREEIASG